MLRSLFQRHDSTQFSSVVLKVRKMLFHNRLPSKIVGLFLKAQADETENEEKLIRIVLSI